MANLLEINGSVRVVADQIGQPTWTRDLAQLAVKIASLKHMPRVVHAVSSGQASWADFAVEVANSIGMNGSEVVDGITTAEYPTPAKRPAWSVLDNSSELVVPIGDWRERWRIAAPEVLASR
jgi:dTDP-4-dehydrorhamnose reductase